MPDKTRIDALTTGYRDGEVIYVRGYRGRLLSDGTIVIPFGLNTALASSSLEELGEVIDSLRGY